MAWRVRIVNGRVGVRFHGIRFPERDIFMEPAEAMRLSDALRQAAAEAGGDLTAEPPVPGEGIGG